MRFFLIYLFLLSFSNANEVDTRANTISKNIRCLVCEGQSVYESNSDFAKDIKNYVKKEIMNNKSDKEIYDFLISKYGQSIIFNPPFQLKILCYGWHQLYFFNRCYIIYRRLGASK